jgi:hypothetical protein
LKRKIIYLREILGLYLRVGRKRKKIFVCQMQDKMCMRPLEKCQEGKFKRVGHPGDFLDQIAFMYYWA